MSATIKQVAERVGVSVSTASHILCGRAERYRPETRENVLRAAAELQYRPNASAQTVKSGRFQTVALVLSDDPDRSALFGELVIGVAAGLKERNYHLSLTMLSDQELTNEDFIPNFLRVWHADGLLIAYFNRIPDRFVQLIEKYGIPSVWINSMQKANCVFSDELRAGREATKYLLDLGHRQIAYADYTAPDEPFMRRRYEGYRTCMQDAGLPARELGEKTYLPRSERIEYSRQWLRSQDSPTAVVAFSATTALPVYEAAVSLGLSIPRDLSILTFSSERLNLTGVHFTTMKEPFQKIGRKAVAMLLGEIEEEELVHQPVAQPFELLKGQTCGPPPSSRENNR